MPDFDTLTLHTGRLHLRPLRADDAAALFAIFSDPEVMRYWSTPSWPSVDEARALIERDARELPAGEHLRLGIERQEDGRLIGTCSLFALVKQCRRAELGYGLLRAAWGQGYMHEALCALLGFGFDELGLNRVEADIDPRNQPSARSLERLGFSKEGFLRERWIVDGEVSDSALYGLLAADWRRAVGRASQ
jgi:ribosomal-protein-alanine N-acetyltransferase